MIQAQTRLMTSKTHFSFEFQYTDASQATQAERDKVMDSLGPTLQALFATGDAAATVEESDSHKGSNNKIVELVTTLEDAQIAEILKRFCEQHAVTFSALE